MQNRTITEAFGWIGVAAILSAYGMNIYGVLDASSTVYLFLNLFGSVGVGVDAYTQRNWQPVVLNLVWMLIAIFGLMQAFLV